MPERSNPGRGRPCCDRAGGWREADFGPLSTSRPGRATRPEQDMSKRPRSIPMPNRMASRWARLDPVWKEMSLATYDPTSARSWLTPFLLYCGERGLTPQQVSDD